MFSPGFLLKFIKSDISFSKKRLFFVVLSYSIGVALLIALMSFVQNFKAAIEDEAKSLLGADLMISSNSPLNESVLGLLSEFNHAQEISFSSLVGVQKSGESRLINVRAIKGGFPYYGQVKLTGTDDPNSFQADNHIALIDQSLSIQLDIQLEDKILLGKNEYTVKGIIEKFPGEAYARTMIAPKVLVSIDSISQSELLKKGSRINYKYYVYNENPANISVLTDRLKNIQTDYQFEITTVEERKERLGRTLENVSLYLILISIVSILLGLVGISSALNSYIKERLPTAITLRCLGKTTLDVFKLYTVQIGVICLISSILGVILSLVIQYTLSDIFKDFLAVNVEMTYLPTIILKGFIFSVCISFIFAFYPLLKLIGLSPISALSIDFIYNRKTRKKISAIYLVFCLLSLSVSLWLVIEELKITMLFILFLFVSVLVCLLFSKLFTDLLKLLFAKFKFNFVFNYALASILRPQNNLILINLTIGIATTLLAANFLTKNILISQFQQSSQPDRPNTVLFDIQTDQLSDIQQLIQQHKISTIDISPIVTMRLTSINNKTNYQLRQDESIPSWILKREYRSTYREKLLDTESLVQGEFIGNFVSMDALIPVTVEEKHAQDLKIAVGDIIEFNVQGVPVKTYVSGIRKVNWQQVQTNFFFVFPAGVLENAPQIFAIMLNASDLSASAKLQRELIQKFPNVSAIDLNLILETIDTILDKVKYVVNFLAVFSLIAGLLILASAIISSRFSRRKELLLLKTLGATGSQLSFVSLIEFLLIALISVSIGIVLGVVGAYLISFFVFDSLFSVPILSLFFLGLIIVLLIVSVGVFITRNLQNQNPFSIIRT